MLKHNQIRIFSGSSNQPLAPKIAEELGESLQVLKHKKFPGGEMFFQLPESVKDKRVVLIQTVSPPINDNLMELFLLCDTFKNAGAHEVIAVLPYLGYSRQDKSFGSNSSLALQLIAKLLENSRVDKLITLDLHSLSSLDFFNLPILHLSSESLAMQYIKRCDIKDIILVAPDRGGVERVGKLAQKLSVSMAQLDKTRTADGKIFMSLIKGLVAKRDCIIIDDIVDSADTLCAAAACLSEMGAKSIKAFATHGILSAGAEKKVINSKISELVITDSIFWANELLFADIIKVQTVAPLFADAVRSFFK